ncbi:M20 family metallo-hydrolase [Enterococcus saccharolyticus]|uniref:M20 family metallo-hydrolase n=1 Tax=Enterococcus saccharolyticus TaxID=41997 RepID=UPI001E4A54DD|nr:M20 family metallo-hydrolase [Enterococcus saccharolyticus]MCD5001144.1 M20 family metallo-hydrolase [Enterococcus saccharolyticus]
MATVSVSEIIEQVSRFTSMKEEITRLVYEQSWVDAQRYIGTLGAKLGMNVAVDEMGTAILSVRGSSEEKSAITIGSHIDSVINAGKYDGVYGVAAGIVAVSELVRQYGQPRKNIQVLSFSEEEGSRFPMNFSGSRFVINQVPENMDELKDNQGITFSEAKQHAVSQLHETLSKGQAYEVENFTEIHIEQGPVLENQKKQIGIVTGIVAQKRFSITVNGQGNHAGTTPMSMRKDALKQAVVLIGRLEEIAQEIGEPLVFTVGKMHVFPNVSNVIPSQVVFSIDIRHMDVNVLQLFEDRMLAQIRQQKQDRLMEILVDCWLDEPAEKTNPELSALLDQICKEKNISSHVMSSGAGHDTQIMNLVVPTALLFVPSRAGISYSPLEYTSAEDLNTGKDVLKEFIYRLAY